MGHISKGVLWLILNRDGTHGSWGNGAHGQCGHVLDQVQLP